MRKFVVGVIVSIIGFAMANGQAPIQSINSFENRIDHGGSLLTSVIDRTITYQGILKDNSGNPVGDANYNLTFRVYNAASGGSLLWTSAPLTVTTKSGLFATNVGPISLPFDTTYYISVQVQGDAEMSRQAMTMVPYAARSDTANYAKAAPGGTGNWTLSGNILSTDGYYGIMKGNAGNVNYGDSTRSIVNLGAACTTGTSGLNVVNAVIGGGRANKASANFSTVSGGYGNKATAFYSTVSGGDLNQASGYFTVVGGGISDSAKSIASGVFSGYMNTAGDASEDTGAFVGGGSGNSAVGKYSVIGGGYNNMADSNRATISGGSDNTVTGRNATISGGWNNIVNWGYSTIGGGRANTAGASDAAIGGGYHNIVSGAAGTIGGGGYNTVSGEWGVVSGGSDNVVSARFTTVGGGIDNSASDFCAVVSGGQDNSASGLWAVIGGGKSDSAKAYYSGVASGHSNLAGNVAEDTGAFVGGGYNNAAIGGFSTISGGKQNQVNAYASCIPGGENDTIGSSGTYSMVFGREVYCNNNYRVVFFDSLYSGSLNVNRDEYDGPLFTYPIHVGTNTSNGNAAYLTTGGVWTNGSSRTFKENFTPIEGNLLLSKIAGLSITSWNYKNTTEKHVGPVAEEFTEAFDTGVIREDTGKRENQYLAAGDVAGVALAGVQELLKKIDSIERRNIELEKKNSELEKRVSELENR